MARKRQLPLKNAWVTANLPPNLTQRNETETNVGSGKTTKKKWRCFGEAAAFRDWWCTRSRS
jgi:hypothetical protein